MSVAGVAINSRPVGLREKFRRRMMSLYGLRLQLKGDQSAYVEWSGRYNFFSNAFMALGYNRISGDYMEFGSHGGATFAMAYHESRRQRREPKLWACDSFAGLPDPQGVKDEHPMWKKGGMSFGLQNFHEKCHSHGVPRDAYETVVGFYEDSLHGPGPYPNDICLAYIDCDLYSSTKTVLEFLLPRLKHGMILGFDDYYCWSPTQEAGEKRALREILGDHPDWQVSPYMTIPPLGMSFVVESRALCSAK